MTTLFEYYTSIIKPHLNPEQSQRFEKITILLNKKNIYEYLSLDPQELFEKYHTDFTTNNIDLNQIYEYLTHPLIARFLNIKTKELAPILYRKLVTAMQNNTIKDNNQTAQLLRYLEEMTKNQDNTFNYIFTQPDQNFKQLPTLEQYQEQTKVPQTINPKVTKIYG